MAQGIEKIPLRIPEKWDAAWYLRHIREVLALADTRNAFEGPGISITGTSDTPATISASADILALQNQPYLVAVASAFLPNERVLSGQPGFITVTDGGPNSTMTVGIDQAMNPRWTGTHVWENPLYGPMGTAALPSFSADESRHAGIYFPDFNQVGISTDSTLRWDVNTTRVYQTLPLTIQNNSGATISNAFDPGAGIEITTSGADALGINGQVAFWEQSTKLYGFRWYMEGTPSNQAYLDLYRHENSAPGVSILRFTRTTGVMDLYTKLQLANGSAGAPSLTWTVDTLTGLFRRGTEDIGIAAFNSRFVGGSTAPLETSVEIQNTSNTKFATLALLDSVGTRQLLFAYGNSGTSIPNTAYLHMPTGIDFLFRSSSVERWRMAGTTGNFRAVDNVELQLGTGIDLRLFHDGTNSTIRNDTGNLSVLSGATEVLRFIQGANSRVHALNGTAALPTFGWFGDPDNGLYYITTNSWGLSTAGTLRYQFGAAGQLGIGGATYGTAGDVLTSGGAAAAPTWATPVVTASGTYTPTLTPDANISATTARVSQYLRVGSTVTVSGSFSVTTTAAIASTLGISLPIASAIANAFEVAGSGITAGLIFAGPVSGNAASDRATLTFTGGVAATNEIYFQFTYRVI